MAKETQSGLRFFSDLVRGDSEGREWSGVSQSTSNSAKRFGK